MSFPIVLEQEGSGEHWNTYASTSQRWPFGTQLVYQGGRKYRFCQAGGSTLAAGAVQQAAANSANHLNVVQTAGTPAAIGARSISIDLVTNTAFTSGMYHEGFFNISDGTGEGYMYGIASHDVNASADTVATTFYFKPGDSIQVATAAATDVTILKHPYDEVVIFPTTATQIPVGVAVKPVAASGHGWIQTRGPASVLTNGTLVVGEGVHTGITTAGAVTAVSTTYDEPYSIKVGFVMHLAATTEYSTIFLIIDG